AHPAGWEVDRSSLTTVLGEESVRALVAVHPNNPTGAFADPSLIELAAAHEVPLIADEVFFPFQLSVRRPDAAVDPQLRNDATVMRDVPSRTTNTYPGRLSGNETVLTFGLDGLSKSLAAPQLKLGWIRLSGPVSNKEPLAHALDEIADTYLSVNSPVALALPDLLTRADSTVTRVTTRLTNNLTSAMELFEDLRIRTTYGGWMMLLDVPPIMDADALCVALMERAGLYVHPGYFYDLPDSTLAISLLPDEDQFRESCVRLMAGLTIFADEQ
ncbi:MAG: aminotransferase class I/II-fold pyridoxal phosphate-dependent enzyme, partial [Propionibacteriaceae bacterium]|nr:aminotransferase class I/II-fold pyridoxal phosphate-dependent enzyme [Propionibacteriaceae bacterium]